MSVISSDGTGLRSAPTQSAFLILVFGGTLLLSAFLLFAIQPMFTKMALPLLGGSPAVWNTAMVFFQAALLAGYAYAHLLVTRFSPRNQIIVHAFVLVAAFAALPIAVAAGWEPAETEMPALWLMALFAVSIGLPFFAVSANAPLLQSWYSRTGGRNADDPYFLYAASNIGSITALVLYPILFETQFTLKTQADSWSAGFIVLAVLIVLCSVIAYRSNTAGTSEAPSAEREHPVNVTHMDRLRWAALAFVPSSLLIGVTTHLSTDVAAAPFLWVLPLILFLLTFVVAFSAKPQISHSLMLTILPVSVAFLLILGNRLQGNWFIIVFAHLSVFFVCAMACHGELWRLRPKAAALTEFYFAMSVGGVLGGAFTVLAAPVLFNSVIEYPLVLVAAMFCRSWGLSDNQDSRITARDLIIPAAFIAAILLYCGLPAAQDPSETYIIAGQVLMGATVFAIVALRRRPLVVALIGISVFFYAISIQERVPPLLQERGFFGVYKVKPIMDGDVFQLSHGTTAHGSAYSDPDKKLTPLAYYHRNSGFADALNLVQSRKTKTTVGIVGLGAGTLACYKRPGDEWTFFEIDPIVVDIARNTDYFSYLADCAPRAPIVVGDARLTLQKFQDASFDLLIIDAFSSDVVPAHLMTLEAITMYLDKLTDGGMVLLHISNRNLDLASVITATAEKMSVPIKLRTKHVTGDNTSNRSPREISNSHVVIIAHEDQALEGLPKEHGWATPAPSPGVQPWTDDYSNIIGALMRKMRK